MMIPKEMADGLNAQITREYESYWIYQQMAYKLSAMGLRVFAEWFTQQAKEEVVHAEKMADYLLDQGGEVMLGEIGKPDDDYSTVEKVCAAALEHEKKITAWIHELVGLARSKNDYATEQFLAWYVSEQVEEVATTAELLDLVKMAKGPHHLIQLENRIMALRGGSDE
ncbi:MAG TPA: ferritin [candidate division Zixibacteria bacterium]|nr:ferritin [candidate division Zixibacteria bacterium]